MAEQAITSGLHWVLELNSELPGSIAGPCARPLPTPVKFRRHAMGDEMFEAATTWTRCASASAIGMREADCLLR